MFPPRRVASFARLALLLLVSGWVGCGASKQRLATEQLVVSDSVDRSVAKIDFSPLSGRRVFLDTKYMLASRPAGFVSPEYVISSLRQQMMAYDLRLQDKIEDAEIVVEARCGVLGSDGHDSSFGIPAGNSASAAASAFAGAPVPALPEISLAKRMDQLGATKVAVFAYDKESKAPIWQSGISTQLSTAKDFFVLGVGPFQRGSIYGGTRFAGAPLKPFDPVAFTKRLPDPVAAFQSELKFLHGSSREEKPADAVAPAGHEEPGTLPAEEGSGTAAPVINAPQSSSPMSAPAIAPGTANPGPGGTGAAAGPNGPASPGQRPVPNDLNWAPVPPRQ
jgi:hypothetical protein